MIRVLRLVEYEYKDFETAERAMAHWEVPPNGSKDFGNRCMIRSSIIMYPISNPDSDIKAKPEDLRL